MFMSVERTIASYRNLNKKLIKFLWAHIHRRRQQQQQQKTTDLIAKPMCGDIFMIF